ncbi:oxidoreductase [bacterium]|nr:oxidoreductase [bacterium]
MPPTMPKPKISQPYTFLKASKKIQNRTVLAAMTNKQSHDDGIISDDEINWLLERAKGGFGVITTAATNVSKEGKAWDGEFGVYDDSHIPSLTKLTSAIHQTKSLIIAQLFHGGTKSAQKITGFIPVSASELNCAESFTGKSKKASEKDIKKIINDFTTSAIRCHQAGFDGIELHGAHGYLISQFLGKKTNLRKDSWGGSLEKRSKLLIEIFKSIRKNVPESFIVGVRISPEIKSLGVELNDSINLIGILRKLPIDFIHLSCWDVFSKSNSIANSQKTLTELITDSYESLPTIISTGNVWSSLDAHNLLKQGADLVGVGRVAIGHPNWAHNVSDLKYSPKKPPFSIHELKKAKLNKTFISYMKNWNNFVK